MINHYDQPYLGVKHKLLDKLDCQQKGICRYCGEKKPDWRKRSDYCSMACSSRGQRLLRIPGHISPSLRFQILVRDHFRCVYCGQTPGVDGVTLHVDHWFPIARGGKSNKDNLFTSCDECNLGKTTHVFEEKDKPKIFN